MPPTAAETMQRATAARSCEVAAAANKINPATGLSTDYINHFTEAIMVLEMAADMPECLADLESWHPKTYREHFEASRFADRDAVIAAYERADPALREALDSAAWALNVALVETRDAVLGPLSGQAGAELAQRTATKVKTLVTRTVAIINGTDQACGHDVQTAVDAMFDR